MKNHQGNLHLLDYLENKKYEKIKNKKILLKKNVSFYEMLYSILNYWILISNKLLKIKYFLFHFGPHLFFELQDCIIKNQHTYIIYQYNVLKGCVCYIFACLYCISKREHLRNKEKCFFISLQKFILFLR